MYREKGKMLHMCFVDLEKVFESLSSKVLELAMRNKGTP